MLYQDLYTRYSRLQFSHNTDRPIAIAGLESRLIHGLNIRGGFGVLDDEKPGLFRRSLLWRRAAGQAILREIDFTGAGGGLSALVPTPPTWSWMAYQGAIEYMDLPFARVDWEQQDIVSPWSSSPLDTWSYSGDATAIPSQLKVVARRFDMEKAKCGIQGAIIILDNPEANQLALECVVLGRFRDSFFERQDEWRHFVLLVKIKEVQSQPDAVSEYSRVGVGSIPGALIDWDEQGNRGSIT